MSMRNNWNNCYALSVVWGALIEVKLQTFQCDMLEINNHNPQKSSLLLHSSCELIQTEMFDLSNAFHLSFSIYNLNFNHDGWLSKAFSMA